MNRDGLIIEWFKAWSKCKKCVLNFDPRKMKVYLYYTIENCNEEFKISLDEQDVYYNASNLAKIIIYKYLNLLELALLRKGESNE